jgi:transposase-like protein
MPYSKGFKMSMVQKLTTPGGPSATQLSREVGVPQSTLSRWGRGSRSRRGTTGSGSPDPGAHGAHPVALGSESG